MYGQGVIFLQQRTEIGMEEKFHLGHKIKTVFEQKQMSVSEFARQIHCERTNVYTIFNRTTIDTDLLARISRVLEYNFFEDVMNEYGLTALFSPQLNIQINMKDCSRQEADDLLHSLSRAMAKNNSSNHD